MSDFLEYVLWVLQRGLALALPAGAAAAAAIGAIYCIHRWKYRGKRRFPWAGALLWLLFLGYAVIVLYATILRSSGGYREWSLHLFRAWREAWNEFSPRNWGNVLLNIAMFVPLGFLLPLMGKPFRRWFVTIPAGFGISLGIELAQLALKRGICDVDDLFCNGLGAMIGFFAVMVLLSAFNEKGRRLKPFLGYLSLLLAPILAIGGIFAAYALQEYGNLPDAASYRVSLKHLDWRMECELPDTAGNAPVYRTQTLTRAECDAVAQRIAGLCGSEVDMVSYYSDMAYYNFSNGVVKVYYRGGGWEFRAFGIPFEAGSEPDRADIERVLEKYSVTVPEFAEFEAGSDGCYSFTCDRIADGEHLYDGTISVCYEQTNDFTHLEIENNLIRYEHHQDEALLSPQEAFRQVLRGNFKYAAALNYDAENAVCVSACSLDYELDTKGYYQPVYRFEITVPIIDYHYTATIPAIR